MPAWLRGQTAGVLPQGRLSPAEGQGQGTWAGMRCEGWQAFTGPERGGAWAGIRPGMAGQGLAGTWLRTCEPRRVRFPG